MGKFKVGDSVVILESAAFMQGFHNYQGKLDKGDIVEVTDAGGISGGRFNANKEGERCWILDEWASLVEAKPTYPNPPHKHREVIIAWANGADIEYKHSAFADWDRAATPIWSGHVAYQVKPSKTPQELKILELEQQSRKLEKQAKELQKTIQELKEA